MRLKVDEKTLMNFNFPTEIIRLIYITNVIENLNRNIRKISRNKIPFPADDSLIKIVYFAIQNQLEKWNKVIPNCGLVLYNKFLICVIAILKLLIKK
ncbi:transposase [Mycoplasma sp. 1781]